MKNSNLKIKMQQDLSSKFDKSFWNKFNSEFKNRPRFNFWKVSLLPITATLFIVFAINYPQNNLQWSEQQFNQYVETVSKNYESNDDDDPNLFIEKNIYEI